MTSNQADIAQALADADRWAARRQVTLSFLAAAGLLLLFAVALNWWMYAKEIYLQKAAVPMRISFADANAIPEILGSWARVLEEEPEPDVIEALRAYREKGREKDDYLFCTYLDATRMGRNVADVRKEFAALATFEKKMDKIREYSRMYPEAVLRLSLSYYTGRTDTVAHIPERCFVAEGFDPSQQDTVTWDVGSRKLEVRYLAFSDQRLRSSTPACNVAYVFHTNGQFMSESLAVRKSLQNLFAKYAYYAKIELRIDSPSRESSAVAMRDFLKLLLPEVEKALPDWSKYQSKSSSDPQMAQTATGK